MKLSFLHLLVGFLVSTSLAVPLFAATRTVKVTIAAGEVARENSPTVVPLSLPSELVEKPTTVALEDDAGNKLVGQITRPGLLAKSTDAEADQLAAELHFILPNLPAGKSRSYTAQIASTDSAGKDGFAWKADSDQHIDLTKAGLSVLRYMCAPLDETTADARSATFKPYHHVFDMEGKTLLTKGPGGLFPHHRGLFFGFNKISYDGGKKKADVWHCRQGEFQSHEEVVASEAGPVLGRQLVKIDWHGQDQQVFASELREMTAYATPGGRMIEFASKLSSAVGPVKLDGDPQHAGFQFRATQEVPDKTAKLTYYLRPDGKGEPGKFRNWPAQKEHANLPWNALSFVVADQRYTCCYLDRPENPKESRFSERDYGRFGSYFAYELDTDKPLELNYRIWLQEGEMDVEQVQRLDRDFVQDAKVESLTVIP